MKTKTSTLLALVVLVHLLQYPVRTLVADVLFFMVARVLDDKTTEVLDVLDISEETLPAYRIAIGRMSKASLWDPDNSAHIKAQADLYVRLGTWADVIRQAGGKLPKGAMAESEAQGNVKELLMKAIDLEPSNPDYHLALYASKRSSLQYDKPKRLEPDSPVSYQDDKPVGFLTDDLEKSVQLFPNSSQIRYEVALQYLLLGEKSKALEHAKILAARDDSYRMPDTKRSDASMERRSTAYLSYLSKSYLTKAFEIAWRASVRDNHVVASMASGEQEARDALELFLETKGVDKAAVVQ